MAKPKISRRTLLIMATVGIIVVICVIVLVSGVASTKGNQDVSLDKDLQLVVVVMRHGIRTPASTFPNDPHINSSFSPYGWGQLTNPGKLGLYNTGKFIRERYNHFFGDYYSSNVFYVQTTDVDRTKSTAQLVNAAIWAPKGTQKWGPLDWQPVPYNYEELSKDNLLLVRRSCPQYHIELKSVEDSTEIKEKYQKLEGLFKNVTTFSGQTIKTFDDAQDIYSTLLAEKTLGLELPSWTSDYFDALKEPTVFSYIMNAYNDKLNRLKGGVFLKKLLKDLTEKSKGGLKPKERKGYLYVGHDSTIVNVLSALKVWDPQLPDYGITILFEFSKSKTDGKFGLEIFLRNSTTESPHQLTIPTCEKFCSLDRVIELTKNVIPENWEEECKSDDPNATVPPPGGP